MKRWVGNYLRSDEAKSQMWMDVARNTRGGLSELIFI